MKFLTRHLPYHEGLEIFIVFLLITFPPSVFNALGWCIPTMKVLTDSVAFMWDSIGIFYFLCFALIKGWMWGMRRHSGVAYVAHDRNIKKVGIACVLFITVLYITLAVYVHQNFFNGRTDLSLEAFRVHPISEASQPVIKPN